MDPYHKLDEQLKTTVRSSISKQFMSPFIPAIAMTINMYNGVSQSSHSWLQNKMQLKSCSVHELFLVYI